MLKGEVLRRETVRVGTGFCGVLDLLQYRVVAVLGMLVQVLAVDAE